MTLGHTIVNLKHTRIIMSTKQKLPKQKYAKKDHDDNQKFVLILVLSTLALMVLMYFIFVR